MSFGYQFLGFGAFPNRVAGFTEATGGSVTTDGNFKVHTFNSSGTFEVTTLGADAVVQYLVVAGGGSGGGFYYGGGGGAGGYRTATNFSVAKQSCSIKLGEGRAATSSESTTYDQGNDSTDSTYRSITYERCSREESKGRHAAADQSE